MEGKEFCKKELEDKNENRAFANLKVTKRWKEKERTEGIENTRCAMYMYQLLLSTTVIDCKYGLIKSKSKRNQVVSLCYTKLS